MWGTHEPDPTNRLPLRTSDGSDLAPDPLAQFRAWLDEANDAGIEEPNAMAMASVDASGMPHVRTLLCKEVTAAGFIFFTNYEVRQGPADRGRTRRSDCASTGSRCTARSTWRGSPTPARGRVRRVLRPGPVRRNSALVVAAVPGHRGPRTSAERLSEVGRTYPDRVPRPENWGGYLVRPEVVEFWQGQPSRLRPAAIRAHRRRQPR